MILLFVKQVAIAKSAWSGLGLRSQLLKIRPIYQDWHIFGICQIKNRISYPMKVKTSSSFLRLSVQIVLMIICLAALESCSITAATTITGTWKDPEAANYKDFFVVVLSKNLPARSSLEKDISKKLKHEGVKVSKSLSVFPSTEKLETPEEKKAAVEKIQGLGHDAIITIVLVRQTEEERYVPGVNSSTPTPVGIGTGYYNPVRGGALPPGSYGSFGGYYANASTAYTTKGYYEMDKNYFVQSNVYDARTSKLVWSAQSETFNPANLAAASSDFSTVMVEAMKKAKILYKAEKAKK